MNNQSSSMGVIVGILIVVVIGIVGFIAYRQGYFTGKTQDTNGIQIQVGGSSDNTQPSSNY